MALWWVITPEYGEVIPVTDDGQGPMEYGCDVIEIEADTKRDAIALGVQQMLRGRVPHGKHFDRYKWCIDQRADGLSPYAGVRAEPIQECCWQADRQHTTCPIHDSEIP